MKNKNENRFYVYAYLDTRKPGEYIYGDYKFDYEPFYIGKGSGKRKGMHLMEVNKIINNNIKPTNKNNINWHKINKIIKIKKETNANPTIKFIQNNIKESDSFLLEIKCIKTIGRYNLQTGPLVNLTDGGEGMSNPSQETRKKMSINTKGKNNPNYGKKASKEKIEKMRRGVLEAYTKNPELKKEASKRTKKQMNNPLMRKKLSDARKGRSIYKDMINKYGQQEGEKRINQMKNKLKENNKSRQIKILQYSNESGEFVKEWESEVKASISLNISIGSISSCINERIDKTTGWKSLSAGGFVWVKKETENFPLKIDVKTKTPYLRPILQYSLNGNLIKKWNSLREVCEKYDYWDGNILPVCKGERLSAYGFMWKYFENNIIQEKIAPFNRPPVHNCRKVVQISLEGAFIAQYNSVNDAQRKTGINGIGPVCLNNRRTAGNFIWKYID